MHKFNNSKASKIFCDVDKRPEQRCPTNISNLSYSVRWYALGNTKHYISLQKPNLGNDIPNKHEKNHTKKRNLSYLNLKMIPIIFKKDLLHLLMSSFLFYR